MADNLSRIQRRYCMSRVANRDTDLERIIRSKLHKKGYRFRKHVPTLPGKPDVVFHTQKIAVFIDGDFWHGYRFQIWKSKVPPFWRDKISKNRIRDRRNFQKLKKMKWRFIRIWQHQIEADPEKCVSKIIKLIKTTR
jgi:DNA mismatch endonuclease, patch repair protein